MSIILKGIDMPNKIDLDFHDNHIVLGGVLYPIDIDQLVYIPTPHGRIIDEDEIYEQPHCGECNDATLDAINNAPTILEAEEEE